MSTPIILPWLRRIAVGLTLTAATTQAAVAVSLTEVADGVFVHQGVHQDYSADNLGDIANIGFIVGEDCVAVVDSGGSPSVGAALRQALRAVTDKPVCYVINTHVHPDHVLGNVAFTGEDARFVGHHRLPNALLQNAEYFVEQFVRPYGEPTEPSVIVPPEILVEDRLELDLGGRILELRAHPLAHTDQDLSVFDVNTETLWLSDLLFIDRIPALDGSVRGWLEVLETLKEIPAERVIPGHGPVSADWPAAAAAQERYLRTLVEEIRALIVGGGFLEDALETVGLSEQGAWLLFDDYHRRNVTKAFAELEWE